jgi:hypothetical protein
MDRYEFKKYLLSELPDSRQEELIFWKKKIPMPVDLVYKMYDERAALFGQYTDHLLSSYIFARYGQINLPDWEQRFEMQPTSANLKNEAELRAIYRATISEKGLQEVSNSITNLLMIPEHEFTEARFIHAIGHEGRKYKRLYIHNEFRKLFQNTFPELLGLIATSNGDMYSNIVADILQVYRMGFADAFSVMFNKLIDYTVGKSLEGTKDYSRESRIKVVVQQNNNGRVVSLGEIKDGSLWEPRYHDSSTSVLVNGSHPFANRVMQLGSGAETVLHDFVHVLASLENESVRDADRKALEILRQQVSRRLRITIEDELNSN